jgi:hypothetical protein
VPSSFYANSDTVLAEMGSKDGEKWLNQIKSTNKMADLGFEFRTILGPQNLMTLKR